MIPWELVERVELPERGGVMELYRHDREFVIRVNGELLMGSRTHASEATLSKRVFEGLGARTGTRILVGGLGMGFTLRAALDQAGPDAEIVVAELVGAVVAWNRGPLAELAGRPLADPRVSLVVADVAQVLRAPGSRFDGILLDVDNGPDALTRASNNWLYGAEGLRVSHSALRPKGILGVWSVADDAAFTRRLQAAGFRVEAGPVRAHATGRRKHFVWLAHRG